MIASTYFFKRTPLVLTSNRQKVSREIWNWESEFARACSLCNGARQRKVNLARQHFIPCSHKESDYYIECYVVSSQEHNTMLFLKMRLKRTLSIMYRVILILSTETLDKWSTGLKFEHSVWVLIDIVWWGRCFVVLTLSSCTLLLLTQSLPVAFWGY